MSKFIISKKFSGVYKYELKDNDIAYYIGVNTVDKKYIKIKVGKKSEGITEQYCHMKRNEYINQLRLGDNPILSQNKKRTKVLFDTFAQTYLHYLDTEKRTGYNERNRYNTHIKAVFGSMDVRDITPEHINALKDKLKASGKSDSTVKHVISFVSFIFNYMIKTEQYNGQNPVKSIKVNIPKVNNARSRYLTHEEIVRLLEAVQDKKVLDRYNEPLKSN